MRENGRGYIDKRQTAYEDKFIVNISREKRKTRVENWNNTQ